MNFVFTVAEEEANILLAALHELPFKTVSGLIGKLMRQGKEQVEAVKSTPLSQDST